MVVINPVERRTVAILAGIFSLRMLGLFMLLPVLPLYANQLKDVTPMLIGVALGIYGLTQAAFQLPFGFISDRLGRRTMIVIGFLLLMLGSVIAASSDSIYGVILGRGLQGTGAVGCVIMALVSDLTRDEVRTRAMAIIGVTIGLSFVMAIFLGPYLTNFGGLKAIFWVTAILSFLAILMVVFFVPEPTTLAFAQNGRSIFSDIPKVMSDPTLRRLNFGVLVLHATLVAVFLKIPPALREMGFAEGTSGQFYWPVLLGSLVSTIPCLLASEKSKDPKRFLISIVFLLMISEWGIGYFLNVGLVGLAVSVWLFFTAFNTLEASLPSLVSKCVSPKSRGTALGIYSSSQFLGIFLGGSIGGWFDAHYGTVGVLFFCFVLVMSWFLWILKGD